MILLAEVILTFIFTNSLMASALDSQLSSGPSKLMCEASQKLLPSERRCEFQVLVTPGGDAGIGSTERGFFLLVSL